MSISTTSAGWRWKCWSASSPVAASATAQPSSSRASFTAVRMRSSSSTARMRVLMTGPYETASGEGPRASGVGGERARPGPGPGRCGSAGRRAGRRRSPGSARGRRRRPGSTTAGRRRSMSTRVGAGGERRLGGGHEGRAGVGVEEVGELEDHGRTLGADGHRRSSGGDGRHGRSGWRARSAVRCRSGCDRVTGRRRAPARQMAAISDGVRRGRPRWWRGARAGRPRCPERRPRRHRAAPVAVEVGDHGAGLGGDQAAGGQVPRREAPLVVGVEAAARHRAEVEGGRALAADVAHAGEHVDEHLGLRAAAAPGRRRSRCRRGRGRGRSASEGAIGCAVPGGAAAPGGAEELVADDVVHHARPPPRRRPRRRSTR